MKAIRTDIPGVLVLEPKLFEDARGSFFESFNQRAWREVTGLDTTFVQDNHSISDRGVLRGIHYQVRHPQAKLVRCVRGEIFDVAVDLRRSAATFGRWVGVHLTAANRHQMWVPEGFAHGFLALSERADVLYKTTDYYDPSGERCILWNDPGLAIDWPLTGEPILSAKDADGGSLAEADLFP